MTFSTLYTVYVKMRGDVDFEYRPIAITTNLDRAKKIVKTLTCKCGCGKAVVSAINVMEIEPT